jgi:hypothetical protein
MTRTLPGLVYSDLRRTPDGGLAAWCRDGWHEARPGDVLDFGQGVLIEVVGPDEIAGGSVFASAAAVLVAMVGMGIAAVCGVGRM